MTHNQTITERILLTLNEGELEKVRMSINSSELLYSESWLQEHIRLCDANKNNNKKIAELLLIISSKANSENGDHFNTLFSFAIINCDIEIVKMLLENGANINAKNQYGRTPLYTAIEHNKIEITELLLAYNADVNNEDNNGITPLHIAINRGHKSVVKLLLQHGANVDDQNKCGKTILYHAVERGSISIVQDVLKYCPDINNKNNRNSLKIAIHGYGEEYEAIADALLEYGLLINPSDANNSDLFHTAIKKGYLEIIESMLKYGANVNLLHNSNSTEGCTPLHTAAKNEQKEIAELLISYGADINATDEYGRTPLHLAAIEGFRVITEILLKFGADVNTKDIYNKTALYIATENNHQDVVTPLLEYGSDFNFIDLVNESLLPPDWSLRDIMNVESYPDSDSGSDLDFYDDGDDYDDFFNDDINSFTIEVFKRHVIKLKTANLYVDELFLRAIKNDELNDFEDKCKIEIVNMKCEKINVTISFYDILVKETHSLLPYIKNENIVRALKSENYETKFPIYAGMIKFNIIKAMSRIELQKKCTEVSYLVFNRIHNLVYDCTEKIVSYMNEKDMKNLMKACSSSQC